jgi:3-oxoacyl-[acyl-carrier protein] reductase
MNFNFSNRNIIVLGSSSGIGFEIVKQLAILNANVCLVGRDLEKLQKSYTKINQLNTSNNKNIYICSDLTKENAIDQIWQEISDKWYGQVDSLVLNAGGPPFMKNVMDVQLQEWLTYFQSLFLSQISLVSKCLDYMKSKKFGRIVSISSSSIAEPISGLVISNTIRPALAAWLKTLANEVSGNGITITNAIIGRIDTDRIRTLDQNRSNLLKIPVTEVMKNNQQAIPAKRYGTTKEAADVILFLLSEYSSYVSGSSVFIDGGATKKYF